MPATALPDQHLEGMEELQEALADLRRTVGDSIADGVVDDDERQWIADAMTLAFDRLSAEYLTASEIACGARIVRALANTFSLTPKVAFVAREAEADVARLTAERMRRKPRRVTPTGTYLELVKRGRGGDDLSAA